MIFLVLISLYLLDVFHLWFNWLIPTFTVGIATYIKNKSLWKRIEISLLKRIKMYKNKKRRIKR